MARLEEVCEILDSKRVPITAKDRVAGPYPYYGANGVQDYVADYIFDDELVLLAEDGGHFGSADKPIAYRVSGKCWVNNHAHVLKAKECIEVDYLCYSLMFRDVSDIVNGATRQKLTQADMRKIEIPLLPIEKQKAVVAKIGKVFELIALRKEQLAKLDELVKSRFIELFGDMTHNTHGWDTLLLDECFDIASSKRILKSEWKDKGIPFLRVRDMVQLATTGKMDNEFFVSEEFYGSLSDSDGVPKQGDILMSATSTLGKCHVVSSGERFYFKDADVLRFRAKKAINPVFFMEQMKTEYIEEQIARTLGITTVAHFTIKAAKTINMRLPAIELQNQFAAFVEQTDKSKLAIQESLAELETLKKALMQKYFG